MMKFSSLAPIVTVLISALLLIGFASTRGARAADTPIADAPSVPAPNGDSPAMKTTSFADFDRRARAGETLNVVFFGASLTWGANASDPLLTSYRADVSRRFTQTYPKAHFHFWDGGIGGTGSQLGVFRLQHDALRHHPDLVFLDFSANDDIYSDDPESLATYESLVRRIITEGNCPLVQVIFPFKWNIQPGEMAKMKRRNAHIMIARAYDTAVGDAIALITARVESQSVNIGTIWPIDGVHPGDEGYELFAEAAWEGFQTGIVRNKVCHAPPKMLYAPTYMTWKRARISQLGPLPAGWGLGYANRTSAFFDFLMSRWLDDEVIASNRLNTLDDAGKPQSIPQDVTRYRARFNGSVVLLFGETTAKSGKYRVWIDGKIVERTVKGSDTPLTEYDAGSFAKAINGNGHYVQVIATGLSPNVTHTLEIEPLFTAADPEQELRLESICVAGGAATVTRAG